MKYRKITALLLATAMVSAIGLSGCDQINSDAVVATLNGDTEITLGYANFVAKYEQASYDGYMSSYYGEGYWTNESYADEDGTTMQDSVKEYVMDNIELGYLLESHMEEYGVEITDEEQEAITQAATDFMDANEKKALKAVGATQEYAEKMLYYDTVSSKMYDAIIAKADTSYTEEEVARRTFSYIEIDTDSYIDDSGNTIEYTDEDKAELTDEAQAVAEAAQTDFEGAASQYGFTVSTYSYGQDEDSEDTAAFSWEVIQQADNMTEGQVSGVIDDNGSLYIIRLDSENDEEAKQEAIQELVSEKQSEYYTEVTDGYKDEADFDIDEDQWDKVQFTVIFDAPEEDNLSVSE